MRRGARFAAALAVMGSGASPVHGQMYVFDPSVYAQQLQAVTQLKAQIDTLKQQLEQAKALYDSFNKLTNANDIAGLLNSSEFRKYLPSEFSRIEGLVSGNGSFGNLSGSIDNYLSQNRYYTGSDANGFYRSELDRIARQTGTNHSLGQSVYDTASKRIDQLEELRRGISSAGSAKETLDLSARLQAETALLTNEILRMQGLAMIQQARTDMDAQRTRERERELINEMKEALR